MPLVEPADAVLYRFVLSKWGEGAQMLMAMEEMGELIAALGQFNRGRLTPDKVAEEIADVMIMMEQMSIIFNEGAVADWRETKLLRLTKRAYEGELAEEIN